MGGTCVHQQYNDKTVRINSLPAYRGAEPSAYNDERQRFNKDINAVRTAVQSLQAAQASLASARADNVPLASQYASSQAQYAGYNTVSTLADQIKTTTEALKRPRQPVAPNKSINEQRQAILALSTKRVQLLQVALFTVLLCTVVYLVLPIRWAHGVAFLIACGGVAVGIFLTST